MGKGSEWQNSAYQGVLPGVPFTWQFTGVVKRMARAQVRNTLQESHIIARRDGRRFLILGDFNAAPPKGRWGYSTGSATVREDGTMDKWVRETDLTEVFQGGKPRPTWRLSEGPQPATLDLVFVSHPDVLPITMSVKWHKSLLLFDHAMLQLCLSRLDAGIGYAGASRPDETATTAPRGYFNMSKWLQLKDE
jgi:hypothetical protein